MQQNPTDDQIKEAQAHKRQGFVTQLLKSGFAPEVVKTWHAAYVKADEARATKMAKLREVVLGIAPAPTAKAA